MLQVLCGKFSKFIWWPKCLEQGRFGHRENRSNWKLCCPIQPTIWWRYKYLDDIFNPLPVLDTFTEGMCNCLEYLKTSPQCKLLISELPSYFTKEEMFFVCLFFKFQSWNRVGFCADAHKSVLPINKSYSYPSFGQFNFLQSKSFFQNSVVVKL